VTAHRVTSNCLKQAQCKQPSHRPINPT